MTASETIRAGANGREFTIPAAWSDALSKPTSAKGRLQRAALAIFLEHQADGALPTSNRFVFYELRQRGEVPLHAPPPREGAAGVRRNDQNTIDATTHLREVELVPWTWVVDETRDLHDWQHAPTVAEYLIDAVAHARINPWQGDPPLILCESRTFGGVLERTLAPEYLCPVAATNGQTAGFLHTDVIPLLLAGSPDRRVLAVCDLDLVGGQIEANTRGVLERALGYQLNWRRVALRQEQVDEHNRRQRAARLPQLEAVWKTDNRYRPARRHQAVEVEALGQTIVTGIIRAALGELLPEPLADVLEREREQRAAVATALAHLQDRA